MSTSDPRHQATPIAPYHSLRVRLPLLISALLVAIVTVFLWAAYREVEATLVGAGGDRVKVAADQVAKLLDDSSNTGMALLRSVAADARVRKYLRNPNAGTRDAARATLMQLITSDGARSVELWSVNGSRLIHIANPSPAPGVPNVPLPELKRPPAVGFNDFRAAHNVIFTDTVAEVLGNPSSAGNAAISGRLGYVVSRSTLSVNPPGILNRLVGGDAVIELGNTDGGTWTDLIKIVPPPPVDTTHNGVTQYRAASSGRRLGAVSLIRGTPWAVWVEFPMSNIVAPARLYLERMILLALIVVVIGALLVGNLTVRITRPLRELARAADGIAAGDYSQKVSAARPDEIGRLGLAFNAMVADVKDAQQQLEARVTELARALEALRASEAHYRTIVEVALDCIITIDDKGRVIEFNPAAEKTFGYKKSDVVGRELAELIVPPASRNAHRKGLARYVATGEGTLLGRRIELTAMRSDGTEFPVELALSAVQSGGSPIVTGVALDISERKRMEEVRLRVQAMEEQTHRSLEANRLKSEFLANMSHELRTPLNAIIGFAYLIHKGAVGPVSAEQKEYLGDILTSSRHLLQLINDVLDLAKVEAGKMEFRPEPVDLTNLVNEVRDTLRVLAADKDLHVDTEIDPEASAAVVDPARVKQILFNYLSNAIKFTPQGGHVHIRIRPEGPDMFRIDVEDTGVGIPAQDLAKLFVEFQQLDAGTSKEHQGTGLGLALIKRLAEAQGGRVGVLSTPGEGSIFSVILPRRMTMAVPDAPSPSVRASLGNRTILVVDDDRATLKLADVTLRELGHRPICTDNAIDALLAAEANPPAVVIADLLMPHMDGFEFISRLRALPGGHDVPILVWTVKDLDASERGRLQSSVAAIVSKRTGGSQALVEMLQRLLPAAPVVKEDVRGG